MNPLKKLIGTRLSQIDREVERQREFEGKMKNRPTMKLFYNQTFKGRYPVGTAAVVVANDQKEAAKLLRIQLLKIGLETLVPASEMVEIDTDAAHAIVLCDGNY